MANNNDNSLFLSTLKYIFEFDTISINDNQNNNDLCKYLSQMIEFTSNNNNNNIENINNINSYKNGELIKILIDIINHEIEISVSRNLEIISKCIIILGQLLSLCSDDIFLKMFKNYNGIETIYNKILLSSIYNNNQTIIYSLVQFLSLINNNTHYGSKIVLNNTEHQFIFQISLILSKNINKFDKTMNKFSELLCKLYHDDTNNNNKQNDEETDDEDDDDENNIKSILNTLIFTGFVTTVTKRATIIKSGLNLNKMSTISLFPSHINNQNHSLSSHKNLSIIHRFAARYCCDGKYYHNFNEL